MGQDLHEARRRAKRQVRVNATFESIRRLTAQRVALGRTRDRHRVEVGRLEEYVGGVGADLTRHASHDARQPQDSIVAVDDDAVFAGVTESPTALGQFTFDAVERGQGLARSCSARPQRSLRHVRGVVRMGGLAQFQHDEVGGVHDVRDRSHSRVLQTLSDPGR